MKHIVILGAGAVGILPAAKMCVSPDIRLTVAADAARVARYRRDGIFFNGEKLPLVFACPEEMASLPPADLIIVATKTTGLSDALENIVPLTDKDTVFYPVLNGITASEVIAERFPENVVLNGFFLGHASVRDKNHIRHDGVGTFYCGGDAGACDFLAGLFENAGIRVEFPEDMAYATWKKFILNVGINQTQAMFYADYGKVQASGELQKYCRELMEEAAAVAAAENIPDTAEMVANAMKIISTMPPEVKTSMLQDILDHRPTEIMAFSGTICAKAEKYGIPVPRNREVLSEILRRERDR